MYIVLGQARLSHFSRVTPQTAAYQAPPFLGFSRQEYWSGVPLPSPIHAAYTHTNVSLGQMPTSRSIHHTMFLFLLSQVRESLLWSTLNARLPECECPLYLSICPFRNFPMTEVMGASDDFPRALVGIPIASPFSSTGIPMTLLLSSASKTYCFWYI